MAVRPQVSVRDATVEDAAQLVELWSQCVKATSDDGFEAFSYQSLWRQPDEAEARSALAFNFESRSRRILVAECEERIVGVVVGDITTLTPISGSRILLITDAQVAPDFRRRSIVSTLLAAMGAHGEEMGCDITVAMVSAHAKEPNRYLTKIGFNQVSVLRAISTGKLRARLTKDASDTGKLVAVRRTLRRRQAAARGVG